MKNTCVHKAVVGFTALVMLVGCSVEKTPVATGGSKADASIVMSYNVGGFEAPVVDWDAAQISATKRCNAWGYKKAEAFEGVQTQCTAYNAYGCMSSNVNRTYQCTN